MQLDFVTVAEYSRPWEAQVAKNFLEDHGIRAFIADEHSSALEGMSVLVNSKLQVTGGDAARAQVLLAR